MADNSRLPFLSMLQSRARRRMALSEPVELEDDSGSDGEDEEQTDVIHGQHTPRRNLRPRIEPAWRRAQASSSFAGYHGAPSPEQTTASLDTPQSSAASPSHGRGSRRMYNSRGRRRDMSNASIASPTRPETGRQRSFGNENDPPTRASASHFRSSPDSDIEEQQWLSLFNSNGNNDPHTTSSDRVSAQASSSAAPRSFELIREALYQEELTERDFAERHRFLFRPGATDSMDDSGSGHSFRYRSGAVKRSRDNFDSPDGRSVLKTLSTSGSAVALMLYRSESPDPSANDVWPNFRSTAKQPIRYYTLKKDIQEPAPLPAKKPKPTFSQDPPRPNKIPKREAHLNIIEDITMDDPPPPGWPPGQLPTELFEEIASYLDRDDIKSMRLVCREFDRHVSQVLFNTVVVPFNTEIYGMLGQEKPDFKGKKKVRIETTGLTWKNANGDDVYNGHGLDVFKGFGKHILKFGMSFEVNEDSLAKPPEKSLTERHNSFWGSYDWPFEEYRRFDDVAGLESAADETPRMKIAFSELTRVKELALSIDSGLGWLNGPDRSIRARVLPKPPEVFGTLKKIPDRRSQAQKELWQHIGSCHREAQSDIKLATLYKLESNRPLSELQGAGIVLQEQPEQPFLDQHIIQEAIPHDAADFQVPTSFDDPEVLERFVVAPSSSGTGILFSSAVLPTDAGQLTSPIIPANLTKNQKEWLMETEWAQRAFLSSYMLSIIDNPTTFHQVHTLNISQLSDRYIGMLSRHDFWNALPGLTSVTLQVIPGWRTVHKDEAGFVETPKISPTGGIDSFYDLLRNIISQRTNIKNLTAGWVTGGEHAEGVHARNKLILPAPFLTASRAVEQDPTTLSQHLLEFPHVEELTLKNCWITPAALLQFVKQHDRYRLRTLVLNSVSLTAVLRNAANAPHQNHAQQALPLFGNAMQPAIAAALGLNAHNAAGQVNNGQVQQVQMNPVSPQQFLQYHIQALQLHIQQLQAQPAAGPQLAALQAQLQNQIQLQAQFQNQNQGQQANANLLPLFGGPGQPHPVAHIAQHHAQQLQAAAAAAAPPPPPPVQAPNARTVLTTQPRAGSWTNVLDIISPGPNLGDFGSDHSQADSERITSLTSIRFISCGYARLPFSQFDQTDIEQTNPLTRNPLITKKYTALSPAMLSAKWPLLGEIVQEIPMGELVALNAGWNLEHGWEDAEEASAAEFDGLLPGGTGRVSGLVRKEDRVVEASNS